MTRALSPDCEAVLRQISAYLDGELPVTECDAIERHCGTCVSCARLVDGLRETIGLCRGAKLAELPESVKARAQASVNALLKGRS